jgi:hypothetical protein
MIISCTGISRSLCCSVRHAPGSTAKDAQLPRASPGMTRGLRSWNALSSRRTRGGKHTIARQRPTDQALADAITNPHATMNPPPASTGDRAGVNPGDIDAPPTVPATTPGDDGRRTSSRPPPPVTVLDAPPAVPSLVTDEEGSNDETTAFDSDAAARALRKARDAAEPERAVPSTARTAAVSQPDSAHGATTHPPPARGARARMTGSTMGASVVDILPEAHRTGWDLRCEVRADTLIQAATQAGEDTSHCVARGTECGGIIGCRCTCAPCTRRRELEDQAYREIKGPLASPLS